MRLGVLEPVGQVVAGRRVVTVAEAAAFLEVRPSWVRALVRRGVLARCSGFAEVRILWSSVERYVTGRRPWPVTGLHGGAAAAQRCGMTLSRGDRRGGRPSRGGR